MNLLEELIKDFTEMSKKGGDSGFVGRSALAIIKEKGYHEKDDSSLSWIEKDQIAGDCLKEFLKDESESSPLYDISSKLLRRLIIEGIDAGLNYKKEK